ncbi:GumC family protein [Roseobacter sp. S98]|uniref:GumC family protein n=1 Tax=Roseobacter algicola (ex Choi et al. 2025) (nom. illeg.) TaxID=3092138 RepID=UPI003F511BB4
MFQSDIHHPSSDATNGRLSWLAISRRPLRSLGWRRLIVGGRLSDAGRLPRYVAVFLLGASALWAPIAGYLATAPLQYTSHASLILPGSGASASVNLNNIGQASSYANSAFSNGSISPTETYKRLISADRILTAAAKEMGVSNDVFGKPRVTLVDQTSLIHITMKAGTPELSRAHADALLAAFFDEIDALRADEIATRETSGQSAIAEYTTAVAEIRETITQLQKRSGLLTAAQYTEQVAAHERLREQLLRLEAEASERDEAVNALEAALGLPPQTAATTLKLFADRQYLALTEDIARHSALLAQAQASFGPRHPNYISASDAFEGARQAAQSHAAEVTGLDEASLAGLDRAPQGERASLLSGLVKEHTARKGLRQRVATLRQQVAGEKARLAALAPLAAELEDKQRDFKVAEAVFASAIARSESTKTDVYASYPLVQVLEDPSLPEAPSSPRRKLSIAAGLAATLLLIGGLVIAWIRQSILSRLLAKPETGDDA